MIRPHLATWLLLAAAATLVHSQYDDAAFQSWQPSRTRKSQTPSLLSNVRSSPQFFSSQRDALPVTSPGAYTPFRPTGSGRSRVVSYQASAQGNVAVSASASDTFGGFQSVDSFPTSRGRLAARQPFSTSEATAVIPDSRDENVRQLPRRGGAKSIRNYGAVESTSEFNDVERSTRGYPRRSTATPVIPEIRQSSDRSRGRYSQRTAQTSPRSYVSSNTPTLIETSTQNTETSGRSQNARKNSSRESKEGKPSSRFPSRFGAAPSARGSMKTSSEKSSESSSVEETLAPSLTEVTERSTVEMPSTQEPVRAYTRGRVRASLNLPQVQTTPRSRQVHRGEKKAALAKELKQKDGEISDEDNYPKEFIEKIKNSAEKNSNPNVTPSKPFASGSRFGRSRAPPASFARPSIDPDISESTNEEVIEQNVPEVIKAKEIPIVIRHRYFGRSKASTTSTEQPTTKLAPKSGQVPSIAKMREKYNHLAKTSQEERLKKLASMRSKFSQPAKNDSEQSTISSEPKIEVDTPTSTTRTVYSSSRFSQFPRNPKKTDDKLSPVVTSGTQHGVRFRPRVSLASRQPDPQMEPATPTVADNARSRNRYSRRSKEELSVEVPEAKTTNASPDSPHESIFNFVHLRTNLTPLASEDVISSFLSNELGETAATSTESASTSAEVMTSTTMRESSSLETSAPTMTEQSSAENTRLSSEGTTASSGVIETTTITRQDPFTVVTVPSTMVTEQSETAAPSQQNELTSTLSPLSASLTSDLPSSTVAPTLSPALSSTTLSSTSAKASSVAPKTTTATRVTTTQRSFLDNRPILKSIVSLFTTTKRPTTIQTKPKPKNKPAKKPAATTKRPPTTKKLVTSTKSSATTPTTTPTPVTTTARAISTSTENVNNNTISPLALSVNVEEVLNSTQELINNHSTSFGSDFSKVPREELEALTPMSVLNTTEANETSTVTETSSTQSTVTSSTDRSVDSQPIIFVGILATSTPTPMKISPPPSSSTTPSTTTAGDYFVYGIYPNNTVVRKRAWKTFDYERYMSPYVIFGIYPNNTIVKKFPNGTVINDEFMTSDNEVAGPSLSATTASTTTSEATPAVAAISPSSSTVATPDTSTEQSSSSMLTTAEDSGGSSSSTTEMSPETTTEQLGDATTLLPEDTTEYTDPEFLDKIVLKINLDFPDTTESSSETTLMPSSTIGGVDNSDTLTTTTASIAEATTTVVATTTAAAGGEDDMTTISPAVNQVLPLTLEEVQSLWSGNFSDAPSTSDVPSRMTTPFVDRTTTTEESTTMEATTTRKPRVKFVTVPPRYMTTTLNYDDVEDSATLPSQHVQRVSKASTQLPEDVFTNLFGSLEQESSSPIPDILKDVNEVEGDGLTAALARRIIALAMERAKSTTPETPTTTTMLPTTTEMTMPPPTTPIVRTTPTKKKKPAGRAIASPSEGELRNVLEQLIKAQDTLALSTGQTSVTSMKPPADLEKTLENQLRLAEEVRKASRNMKKKKKKSRPTTTTPAPRPILGFLFNFFNRPSATEQSPTTVPNRTKVPSSANSPDSQLLFLTSVPSDESQQVGEDETAGNSEVQGERQTRSQLLTAAIDVTRAVGKLMGTVMNNAAQSFQSFVRTNWGR